MANGIQIEKDTLTPGVKAFPFKMAVALSAVMKYHEPQVASYMKNNAPWTDRTANARNGLDAKAYETPTVWGIVCFHQMPYGIWLEVCNDGRYAIIKPTILHEGQSVMNTVAELLRRMAK